MISELLRPPPPITQQPFDIGGVPIPSRFFLAPLAGYTSLAYRLAVRENGGLGLATTDLVNARAVLENRRRSAELSQTCPEDRPIAIQLYGHVIAEMTEAAKRMVDQGATIIDINMGCPVRKVVKSGGGSALMCEPNSAANLVEAMVRSSSVPVTVKMRLGWDADNLSAPTLAREFESAGAAAVILHGRTREQGFRGSVDREGIRLTVEAVNSMPIVGNGDVLTIADAETMFRETGCAAISIGRGSLANPFIFRQLKNWSETGDPGPEPTFSERVDVMERHFARLVEHRGERTACLEFRKLIKWYNHAIRPQKTLYHRLINLPNSATFFETLQMIRDHGPIGELPSHFEPRVPVPSGPIDKW